jgi:hypothetical protein
MKTLFSFFVVWYSLPCSSANHRVQIKNFLQVVSRCCIHFTNHSFVEFTWTGYAKSCNFKPNLFSSYIDLLLSSPLNCETFSTAVNLHCLLPRLQVLEQLSGQSPVFSKGTLAFPISIFSLFPSILVSSLV